MGDKHRQRAGQGAIAAVLTRVTASRVWKLALLVGLVSFSMFVAYGTAPLARAILLPILVFMTAVELLIYFYTVTKGRRRRGIRPRDER